MRVANEVRLKGQAPPQKGAETLMQPLVARGAFCEKKVASKK